ncbi:hypothetical protein MJO29_008539 [Puccinia striiformis f. sp. tritici]|nr:hypothetical protein MJO29_008539 [Puccinia striiformis f. sp. tritici]
MTRTFHVATTAGATSDAQILKKQLERKEDYKLEPPIVGETDIVNQVPSNDDLTGEEDGLDSALVGLASDFHEIRSLDKKGLQLPCSVVKEKYHWDASKTLLAQPVIPANSETEAILQESPNLPRLSHILLFFLKEFIASHQHYLFAFLIICFILFYHLINAKQDTTHATTRLTDRRGDGDAITPFDWGVSVHFLRSVRAKRTTFIKFDRDNSTKDLFLALMNTTTRLTKQKGDNLPETRRSPGKCTRKKANETMIHKRRCFACNCT